MWLFSRTSKLDAIYLQIHVKWTESNIFKLYNPHLSSYPVSNAGDIFLLSWRKLRVVCSCSICIGSIVRCLQFLSAGNSVLFSQIACCAFCLNLFSFFIIVSIPSIDCPCNCHACIIRDKSNIVSRSKQIEGYQDVLIARMDATVIYDRLKWRDDCCHNEQTGGCFDLQ